MSEQHKHAAVLRAIADGVPICEFEARLIDFYNSWSGLQKCYAADEVSGNEADGWITHPEKWEIRRKQKTHIVNGFTVPEPLLEIPPINTEYFVESLQNKEYYEVFSACIDYLDFRALQRGIAHATQEGAIANCKARLGIDHYKDGE